MTVSALVRDTDMRSRCPAGVVVYVVAPAKATVAKLERAAQEECLDSGAGWVGTKVHIG